MPPGLALLSPASATAGFLLTPGPGGSSGPGRRPFAQDIRPAGITPDDVLGGGWVFLGHRQAPAPRLLDERLDLGVDPVSAQGLAYEESCY